MKLLMTFIILLFSFCLCGQSIKSKPFSGWQPIFYLDSIPMGSQLHFDPNKIANINVVSNYYDSTERVHGKIFITSKDKKAYNFLTVSDLKKIYKTNLNAPTLFMLDDEFLKDISTFKIDSSYILEIKIIKGSEIDYLRNTLPELTVFEILTRTKENLDKQKRIRIRGKELAAKD